MIRSHVCECNAAACKRVLLIFYMKHEKWLRQRADQGWLQYCKAKCSAEGYQDWLKLQEDYEEGRRIKHYISGILEYSNRKRGMK